jgi:N-acetylglucosaminyl-diphospho-decaprenol L-rhamnosyltransferase
MKIGIGVVTYNNDTVDLERFVRSLTIASAQLGSAHEVVLYTIDNGAVSPMAALHPQAVVLPTLGNIGYTKAINLLMKQAFAEGADAFICSNPDGAFHYKSLEQLVLHSKRFPDALIEAVQFPEEHPKIYDPESCETDWASGCCLFITRALHERVGGFDEHFFMYMEDVDFSWRVRAAGMNIRMCPSALFAHAVIGRAPNRNTSKYFLESGRYLAAKWGDVTFQTSCERQLITDGFYASLEALPPLPQSAGPLAGEGVTCFSRNFSFAEVRW